LSRERILAARLGLDSALVVNLGDDHNGHECIATLHKNGVATDFVNVHKDKETNYHYVLWFEEDRTILIKHHEYTYHTRPRFAEMALSYIAW
jgi:sugar/nucleoside kinase (ribokinase family)